MMKVAIIGSGPAGLMAAWRLGLAGIDTSLFEKNDRLGKKILASGGGMCNFTHNESVDQLLLHYGDHGRVLRHALKALDAQKYIALLGDLGIEAAIRDDNKVFVGSGRASDYVLAFERALTRLGVRIHKCTTVKSIVAVDEGALERKWNLFEGDRNCLGQFDAVILATGGCSYPGLGTSGDGYIILERLQLDVVPPRPALTSVIVKKPLASLAGLSVLRAEVQIYMRGQLVKVLGLGNGLGRQDINLASNHEGQMDKKQNKNQTELLITHKGLSGPLILNGSRYMLDEATLKVNWTGLSQKQFEAFLQEGAQQHGKRRVLNHLLTLSEVPEALIRHLFLESGVIESQVLATMTRAQRSALEAVFVKYTFEHISLEGFDRAMVTAGGLSIDALNHKTFAVKNCPHLYVVGEVVDLDGDTGGYNIHAAAAMGYCAATAIAKDERKFYERQSQS